MTSTPALRTGRLVHRPAGAGHPYTPSPDQRLPVRPRAGEPVRLGVVADPGIVAIRCTWTTGDVELSLPMAWTSLDPEAQLAMAGGEGHLAAAQAAGLAGDADGAWVCTTPPVTGSATYTFVGADADGTEHVSAPYLVSPLRPAALAGTLEVHGDPADRVAGEPLWLEDDEGMQSLTFSLRLAPGEHVVGLGERFDAVDQRGRTPDNRVFEQYKGQARHRRTYLPMPFAHVLPPDGDVEPWAFHVATTRRVWFDVGAADPDLLTITVELAGESDHVDLHLWQGDPAASIQAFTTQVGRAEPLPDWVHRLWASGNEWNTQALVMEQMDLHTEHDVPVGVVVIEAWSDERGFVAFRDSVAPLHKDGSPHDLADFTFGDAWPDPAAMVRELHDRGIKVLLWQIPLQKTRHELGDGPADQAVVDGEVMVARGNVVHEPDGTPYLNRGWWFPRALMPDLSDPAARARWTDKRRYLVRDLGIDGFKTDGGEHAWGDDLRYADGTTGAQTNNRYPVLYAQAFGDLLRSEGRAPVTFSRAGTSGSQAHGLVWAGDEDSTWEAFRASITAGITASSCGLVYWGWDLAGFSGPVPHPELYLRAAAAATFMPVMQYHSEFNHHRTPRRDRTPWCVAETHDAPWVVEEFRRWAQLRERLVAYLAEQARVAIGTGRPLMRGLFLEHRDPEVWRYPHQFMLGDDLLVCPVTEPGVTQWEAWLPPGEWVDVWTGERSVGGQVVRRSVPIGLVPVWCPAERWPAWQQIVAVDLP